VVVGIARPQRYDKRNPRMLSGTDRFLRVFPRKCGLFVIGFGLFFPSLPIPVFVFPIPSIVFIGILFHFLHLSSSSSQSGTHGGFYPF
jgi:hypothetical protein